MTKEFCDSCGKEIKSAPLRNVIVYTDSFTDAAGSKDTYENAFCLCAVCARDFNSVLKAVKGEKKVDIDKPSEIYLQSLGYWQDCNLVFNDGNIRAYVNGEHWYVEPDWTIGSAYGGLIGEVRNKK
jgi:copper chaperone CopZ